MRAEVISYSLYFVATEFPNTACAIQIARGFKGTGCYIAREKYMRPLWFICEIRYNYELYQSILYNIIFKKLARLQFSCFLYEDTKLQNNCLKFRIRDIVHQKWLQKPAS